MSEQHLLANTITNMTSLSNILTNSYNNVIIDMDLDFKCFGYIKLD